MKFRSIAASSGAFRPLAACVSGSDSTTPSADPNARFQAQFMPLVGMMPFPNDLYFSGSTTGPLNIPGCTDGGPERPLLPAEPSGWFRHPVRHQHLFHRAGGPDHPDSRQHHRAQGHQRPHHQGCHRFHQGAGARLPTTASNSPPAPTPSGDRWSPSSRCIRLIPAPSMRRPVRYTVHLPGDRHQGREGHERRTRQRQRRLHHHR